MKVNCFDKAQAIEIAKAHGLFTVTVGKRGATALTGFDTFEEAEQLANELGGEVTTITQKNGEQYWHSEGKTYEAFDIKNFLAGDYKDCCTDFIENTPESISSYIESQKDLISEMLDNANDFDELDFVASHIGIVTRAKTKVELLDEGEFLFIVDNDIDAAESYNKKDTYYDYDVTTWRIAVELPEPDEE